MFLQIEDNAIAIEHIISIYFQKETQKVTVWLGVLDGDQAEEHTFTGKYYDAFMNWWEHKADVYKALS